MGGKVFFSVSMSLDGYIAPKEMVLGRDPQLWLPQWMELQQWVFPLRFFRENLKLGEGGEEGLDNDIARDTFERTGASVMGKRMFDGGALAWPEEAPFHTPVFVVTHEKRDPWERPGGTTFHFVNDGIESALDQAREAAGDRDVRIAGGGATILEYVNAGLVDEFSIALSPVLFGSGIRLFEGVGAGCAALEPVRAESTQQSGSGNCLQRSFTKERIRGATRTRWARRNSISWAANHFALPEAIADGGFRPRSHRWVD